ncbi:MAG: response regulator [Oligoflexia bacterium]|nr:response regulator [Oligoflexia bacterium]
MMGKRIVVADDSRTVQKVITLILEPSGYEVVCFDNVVDAFESVKKTVPSIVFADVGMNDMSGYDLGMRMQADKELKNIPLILLYGGFDDIKTDKYVASGASDKLSKPFDAKQLLELVRKYVISPDSPDKPLTEVATAQGAWDMESFDEEPVVPDLKEPLKIMEADSGSLDVGINVNTEAEEDYFKLGEDEKIESMGIPEPHERSMKKNYRTEDLSEEESKELMTEFNLVEEYDGTIKFREEDGEPPIEIIEEKRVERSKPEDDGGLWINKDYMEDSYVSMGEPIVGIAGTEEGEGLTDDVKEAVGSKMEKIIKDLVRDMLPGIAEKLVREEIARIINED